MFYKLKTDTLHKAQYTPPTRRNSTLLAANFTRRDCRHWLRIPYTLYWLYTPCLKKTVQTYFLSELCQISTDCKNFWQKDSRENKHL